jgi:RecB family exonuclease
MLLKPQVQAVTLWWALRRHVRETDWRSERGDAYTSTIMIAIGVVIAITVGGILLVKFTGKAESIDTDTPIVPAGP